MNITNPVTPAPLTHKQLKGAAKASRPWFRKKRFWALAVLVLMVGGSAAGGGGSTKDKDALPAGSDKFPTETTAVQAGSVEAQTPAPQAPVTVTTGTPAVVASSCDVAREALLTGTDADKEASMRALMADKTADATAREYADYYLNRDRTSPDMREMDVSLIRMGCS